jgi:hypothetical protein
MNAWQRGQPPAESTLAITPHHREHRARSLSARPSPATPHRPPIGAAGMQAPAPAVPRIVGSRLKPRPALATRPSEQRARPRVARTRALVSSRSSSLHLRPCTSSAAGASTAPAGTAASPERKSQTSVVWAFSGNDDDVRRFHPDTATAGYRSNGEPGERARYHVGYYTHSCSTPTATTSKSSTTTVGRECDPDGARDPQSRGPQKRHDPEAWTPEEVDEDAGRVGQCSVASRCLGISFLGSMNGISTTTAWRRSPATSTSSSVPSSASSIGTMA